MKCPNCGMDIVIATHLCPHCGYAHDFDGAIEPRCDLPEPWDLTPDTTRRRDRHEPARSAHGRNRQRHGKPQQLPQNDADAEHHRPMQNINGERVCRQALHARRNAAKPASNALNATFRT